MDDQPESPAPDGAAAVPARARRGGWELLIALALAVTSVSGAVLTYLSVQQEAAAAGADERAVIETILVEQREAAASADMYTRGEMAARYRRLLAQADALQATDPARAAVDRQLADAVVMESGIWPFLLGTGATSRYDYERNRKADLEAQDIFAIPRDQPARTAARATDHRDRSAGLTVGAVGMLVVVVLLTLARVGRRQWRRVMLFGAATFCYVAVLALNVVRAI